jgi:hypothetical protein
MRVIHQIGRTCDRAFTITDAADVDVVLASGDTVRVKVGRQGQTPIIDLDSNAPTANGSSCTAANPSTVRLHQDDLNRTDFVPGVYTLEVLVIDDSDSDIAKHAGNHVLILEDTPQGSVAVWLSTPLKSE